MYECCWCHANSTPLYAVWEKDISDTSYFVCDKCLDDLKTRAFLWKHDGIPEKYKYKPVTPEQIENPCKAITTQLVIRAEYMKKRVKKYNGQFNSADTFWKFFWEEFTSL